MSSTTTPIAKIYAFGDSLSDGGNDSVLTSAIGTEPISPPYYHTNVTTLLGLATQAATVFSNGPVWVQDLSVGLGLGTLDPSLLGGNDFAYGGAETGSTPQNAGNATVAALSLPAQISQFASTRSSIASDALVTLSIGGNDIFDILANTSLTAAQQATDVTDAVNNEISAIQSLSKMGADNFLVFNVPNLGLVPEVTFGLANGSDKPSAAVDATATQLSASYDAQLAAALSARSAATGENIHILDAYSLIDQASANPSAFGLTNTTTPVWSGNFTSANSGTLAATSPAQQNQYLFFDDFHPTASVHQDLANTAAAEVGPNPSANVTVNGAAGNVLTVALASVSIAEQIQLQLAVVTAGIAAGSVLAEAVTSAGVPAVGSNQTGFAEIDTAANVVLPTGYGTVIDMAAGASTVAASAGSQLVLNGGTGTLLYAANTGLDTISAGAGGGLIFGNGAALNVFDGTGATTLVGGSAGNAVDGGGGNQLIFGNSTLAYAGGAGAATIVGGASGNSVTGGGGSLLVFANAGMTFTGGSGAATVVGGSGSLTATLGGGGGDVFGGAVGGNSLSTGSGSAILFGGGTGDVLTATGSGSDILAAGAGAETLNGAAATGSLILFGGSGADCIADGTGQNVFVAGSGNETLTAGAGTNDFIFSAAPGTTRTDIVSGFNPSTSAVVLEGYGTGADAQAFASAQTSGGTTTISLSDGTHLVFTGAPSLTSGNFV